MKTFLKFLIVLILTVITNDNLLPFEPIPPGGDTLVMTLDCSKDYFASPFVLLPSAGDFVKFVAVNGRFSILIRGANQFFEGVQDPLKIIIDSNGNAESDTYTIISTLGVGSEIRCEVVCLTTGIIADVPPKIIIVPRNEQ